MLLQVPTLTNEGGCLKRDRRLQQGVDYETVPESLWKALALWYGKGTYTLPRTVSHAQYLLMQSLHEVGLVVVVVKSAFIITTHAA